jgi:hypothetical protein
LKIDILLIPEKGEYKKETEKKKQWRKHKIKGRIMKNKVTWAGPVGVVAWWWFFFIFFSLCFSFIYFFQFFVFT